MIFDERSNEIILASGKRFYAYGFILGLRPGAVDKWPFYGHDGSMGDYVTPSEPLTRAEAIEIAENMVEAWATWAANYGINDLFEEGWQPCAKLNIEQKRGNP